MDISIHRPLAGPDDYFFAHGFRLNHFNPQAPCGARRVDGGTVMATLLFQSTGPLRGPTQELITYLQTLFISIHRPLAGPDLCVTKLRCMIFYFNPQAPCGARHKKHRFCDAFADFNPQAPCGARPSDEIGYVYPDIFQSTGPLRGPTVLQRDEQTTVLFQSTGPLRGPTMLPVTIIITPLVFQSTGPLRGPTHQWLPSACPVLISIHRPLAGPDGITPNIQIGTVISIHRPLAGPDRQRVSAQIPQTISIHRPLAGPD